MSNTTSSNTNVNNKSSDKENISGEGKPRRSNRTSKPSEKVRERTLGSPNGNKYGIRRVIRERRQPQYEKVLRNRRINFDVPADTSIYQLSREWVADNPNQYPDHVVAVPIDSTVVLTQSRTLASILQNPQLAVSDNEPKFNTEGLPIRAKKSHDDFDKIIRHEQVSTGNPGGASTSSVIEEDEDLLSHHLDHFKKVKAWWQSAMETRLVPAKQQIEPILASSANSDEAQICLTADSIKSNALPDAI